MAIETVRPYANAEQAHCQISCRDRAARTLTGCPPSTWSIPQARETGVAVGGLVRANHIGRLGHYAELATAEGLISLVCAGGFGFTGARAAPFGGRDRLLDTNSSCMGFPAGREAPVIIDFATTSARHGCASVNRETGSRWSDALSSGRPANPR